MTPPQSPRNEAAERLRGWIEETPDANVALRQAATTALDAALAEERRNLIAQIRKRLTAYDYWATRDVNDYEADTDEMQSEIVALLNDPGGQSDDR